MRAKRRLSVVDGALSSWRAASHSSAAPVITRQVALRRWGAASANTGAGQILTDFTSMEQRRSDVTVRSTDVKWRLEERLEFALQYYVPVGWDVREKLAENHISIQCSPPKPSPSPEANSDEGTIYAPSVHGLSLNCFAYHRKVVDADAGKLLVTFLKRFGGSCSNSVVVHRQRYFREQNPLASSSASSATATAENVTQAGEAGGPDISIPKPPPLTYGGLDDPVDFIAARVGGAVCEISFAVSGPKSSGSAPIAARALCRAFYSKSRRGHVVAMMAVPVEEFAVMKDAVAQGVMHVTDVTKRET